MTAAIVRTILCSLILPPSPALGGPKPNLSLSIGTEMHVLSECGRKQLMLSFREETEAVKTADACPVNGTHAAVTSLNQSSQNVQIVGILPDCGDLLDTLHNLPNLQGIRSNDLLHAEGRTAYTCHTNGLDGKPVIPESRSVYGLTENSVSSGISSRLPSPGVALDWLLGPKKDNPENRRLAGLIRDEAYLNRLLKALERVEAQARKDADIGFAEDARQSWIALNHIEEFPSFREASAWACTRMFGVHVSQLQERIIANRKARLGREFWDWYDSEGRLRPDINLPKPVASSGNASVPRVGNTDTLPDSSSGEPGLPEAGEAKSHPIKPSPALLIQDEEKFA